MSPIFIARPLMSGALDDLQSAEYVPPYTMCSDLLVGQAIEPCECGGRRAKGKPHGWRAIPEELTQAKHPEPVAVFGTPVKP